MGHVQLDVAVAPTREHPGRPGDGRAREGCQGCGPRSEIHWPPIVRIGERGLDELGPLVEVRGTGHTGLEHHEGESVRDGRGRDAAEEPRQLVTEHAVHLGVGDEFGDHQLVVLVGVHPGGAQPRLAGRLDRELLHVPQGGRVERIPVGGPQGEHGLVGGQLLTRVRRPGGREPAVPAPDQADPLLAGLREHGEPAAGVLVSLGVVCRGRVEAVGAATESVERVDVAGREVGVAPDLHVRGEAWVAEGGGVLGPLGHDRPAQLLPAERDLEPGAAGGRPVRQRIGDASQRTAGLAVGHRRRRGLGEQRAVGSRRPVPVEIGPVHLEMDGQLGKCLPHIVRGEVVAWHFEVERLEGQACQPVEVGGERVLQLLTLGQARQLAEGLCRPAHLGAERAETADSLFVEEQCPGVVAELVARRAVHGPARVECLAGSEDLLHDDDAVAQPLSQAAQVGRGVAQPVDVVDAHAGDAIVVAQDQDQFVGALEDLVVLDPHAHQAADVEEPPVVPLGAGRSPVGRPEVLVLQNGADVLGCRGVRRQGEPSAVQFHQAAGRVDHGVAGAEQLAQGTVERGHQHAVRRAGSSRCRTWERGATPRRGRSTSHHHSLAGSAAMWLGTMSRRRRIPCAPSSSSRARNSSAEPSAGSRRPGSITS